MLKGLDDPRHQLHAAAAGASGQSPDSLMVRLTVISVRVIHLLTLCGNSFLYIVYITRVCLRINVYLNYKTLFSYFIYCSVRKQLN